MIIIIYVDMIIRGFESYGSSVIRMFANFHRNFYFYDYSRVLIPNIEILFCFESRGSGVMF